MLDKKCDAIVQLIQIVLQIIRGHLCANKLSEKAAAYNRTSDAEKLRPTFLGHMICGANMRARLKADILFLS